jgi:hypothetical protein
MGPAWNKHHLDVFRVDTSGAAGEHHVDAPLPATLRDGCQPSVRLAEGERLFCRRRIDTLGHDAMADAIANAKGVFVIELAAR